MGVIQSAINSSIGSIGVVKKIISKFNMDKAKIAKKNSKLQVRAKKIQRETFNNKLSGFVKPGERII